MKFNNRFLILSMVSLFLLSSMVMAVNDMCVVWEQGRNHPPKRQNLMLTLQDVAYPSDADNVFNYMNTYCDDGQKILVIGSNEFCDKFAAIYNEIKPFLDLTYPNFMGCVNQQNAFDNSGHTTNTLKLKSVDGKSEVDFSGIMLNTTNMIDMNINDTTSEIFNIKQNTIIINESTLKDTQAIVTVETETAVPPIIMKNGEVCNSETCHNISWNSTETELNYIAENFSTYTFSSSSNIFTIYEPPASCTSSQSGVYFGCTGRYGLAVEWSELTGQCDEFVNQMSDNCMGDINNKIIFSGSNQWHDDMATYCGTIISEAGDNCIILGKIKGQSNHDALMGGTSVTSLVIDSEYETVTYDASSTIDMSSVLDMSVDTLVTGNPFMLVENLVAIDSSNFPTLDKSANIKFKGVTQANPRVLRNGEECPDDVCTNIAHDTTANTLSVDVTGFSNYSLSGYSPTYDAEDVAPLTIDGIASVFVLFVSFASLAGIALIYVWAKKKI